jgi:transposase
MSYVEYFASFTNHSIYEQFLRVKIYCKFIELSYITSISFEGAYRKDEEDEYIDIAHGYSRDRRPDLKQATLGIDVTHEYGVPLTHKAASGNVTDVTTYKENLERIQKQLHIPVLLALSWIAKGKLI